MSPQSQRSLAQPFFILHIYFIIFFLKNQIMDLFNFLNWAVLQTPFTAFLRQTFPGSIKTPVVVRLLLPFAHPIFKRDKARWCSALTVYCYFVMSSSRFFLSLLIFFKSIWNIIPSFSFIKIFKTMVMTTNRAIG